MAMVDQIDIYRVAKLLMGEHGDDAPIQAAMKADEMAEKDDVAGYTMWKFVLKAIDELRDGKLPPETTVH